MLFGTLPFDGIYEDKLDKLIVINFSAPLYKLKSFCSASKNMYGKISGRNTGRMLKSFHASEGD